MQNKSRKCVRSHSSAARVDGDWWGEVFVGWEQPIESAVKAGECAAGIRKAPTWTESVNRQGLGRQNLMGAPRSQGAWPHERAHEKGCIYRQISDTWNGLDDVHSSRVHPCSKLKTSSYHSPNDMKCIRTQSYSHLAPKCDFSWLFALLSGFFFCRIVLNARPSQGLIASGYLKQSPNLNFTNNKSFSNVLWSVCVREYCTWADVSFECKGQINGSRGQSLVVSLLGLYLYSEQYFRRQTKHLQTPDSRLQTRPPYFRIF